MNSNMNNNEAPSELQSVRMRANIQERTGKSLGAWVNIARSLGTDHHKDIVAYLKAEGHMSHSYANLVAHEARKPGEVVEIDPIEALFAGDKETLKPIYDAICKAIKTFGKDITFVPKKDCVSVRRKKQFAILQPSAAKRLDIGLHLKQIEPTGNLELAGTWNGMLSHRVRIAKMADFDLHVKLWLEAAYDQAG